MIASLPTKKELEFLEPILRSGVHFGKPQPNICISVYKNRGGKYKNVKIWLYIDYDTMRVSDQFVTDYDHALLPIQQKWTRVDENQNVVVYTDKEELIKDTISYEEVMDIIDIPEDSVDINTLELEDDKNTKELKESNTEQTVTKKTKLEQVDETKVDFEQAQNKTESPPKKKRGRKPKNPPPESLGSSGNNLVNQEEKTDSRKKNNCTDNCKKPKYKIPDDFVY